MRYLIAASFVAVLFATTSALAQDAGVCADGGVSCNGTCTNTQTDPTNCGACGLSCSSQLAQSCLAGVCGCTYGEILPSGHCIGTGSDAGVVLVSPSTIETILSLNCYPSGASNVFCSLTATATSSTGALQPTTITAGLTYAQSSVGSMTIATLYAALLAQWHLAAGF